MSAPLVSQVAIFWDYENCNPPSSISGTKLADNIRILIRSFGPIKVFKAYLDVSCNVNQRSTVLHSELQSSGVTLVHCPHNGKKDVADNVMIVDILVFAMDNPPPVTITIITGDRDFAYALAILRLRGYKIIVIMPPDKHHESLKTRADNVFDWQKDIACANGSDGMKAGLGGSVPAEPCRNGLGPDVQNIPPSSNAPSQIGAVWSKPNPKPKLSQPNNVVEPSMAADTGPSTSEISSAHRATGCSSTSRQSPRSLSNASDTASSEKVSSASCSKNKTISNEQSVPSGPSKSLTVESNSGANSKPSKKVETSSKVSLECSPTKSTSSTSQTSQSRRSTEIPNTSSIERFQTLIDIFIEYHTKSRSTQIPAAIVGSLMRKRDSNVYERAGVRTLKQYIEEAQLVNIIISPGMDSNGGGWIEINKSLYPATRPAASHVPKRVMGAIAEPLLSNVPAERPSYALVDLTASRGTRRMNMPMSKLVAHTSVRLKRKASYIPTTRSLLSFIGSNLLRLFEKGRRLRR